ncbi:MBL fold metallo-hydrolase [Catenuloplanes atrovinosus]|uniref:L-ascorbate metabolism protein UlaG (Beta-lactamase superfamily) n=1 Tax=Catenuloplanes atrovinosus TaxID=137266 RepID=A0AAE3YR80_9ACTN|nr:MBL fold metallo-hydrolase [Catenuloplanes atrovinosus]MDR7276963.1 L-ascorbate metabolism protein UlaG (beta-lactamase superfamily) [Catenuloplanes atrovinosus]
MSDEHVFLRPNTIIEPLVDRFYASMYATAPVMATMTLANRLIPMMESYLQAPEWHFRGSRDPKFRGGFFINVDDKRADEVAALLATIRRDRADMIRFAEAIAEAEKLVLAEATGYDLRPLYPKLPAELAGLVEVTYDTNNAPSMHFQEPLVYKSKAYTEDRQSVQISVETGIERPFVMSTPRLPSPDVLELSIPFHHPGLEALFRSRVRPTTPGALREALELDDAQAAQLSRLLVPESALASDRHVAAGARIRYWGHACLLMQTPDVTIMTDPFISADTGATGRYTYNDLPDFIDYVLITHGHSDHLVPETLLQLRGRVGTFIVPRSSRGNLPDPSLALYLRSYGLPAIEVNDFDEVEFPGGKIVATPFFGEHADLDIRAKSTYFVRLGGKSIFVGADSSGVDPVLYRYVRAHLGRVDIAFIGMECDGAPLSWQYQPYLTKALPKKMAETRKMSGSDAAQAAEIVTELGAEEAYIYAMGEESWLGHVMATSYNEDSYQLQQIAKFETWCANKGVKFAHLLDQHEWNWSQP